MIASVSVEPKEVECCAEQSDRHGSLVILVIVEGGIA